MLFFAQRFDELTWAYALDSYRAPTTNPPALIDECIRNFRLNKKINRSAKSLSHIINETRERLKKNPISAKCYTLPLEKYFEFDVENYDLALDRLTLLSREVSQSAYLSACSSHILAVAPTNKKSEIDFACREYASTLLNVGYDPQFLNEICVGEFFNPNRPVNSYDAMTGFLERLKPKIRSFSVIFHANSNVHELASAFTDGFGIKSIRKMPRQIEKAASEQGVKLPSSSFRMVGLKEVDALDEYGALAMAQSRVNWVHDIYGLFRHRSAVDLANEAVIFDVDERRVRVLRTDANQMHRISDNRPDKANEKLEKMLTNLRFPRFSDKQRFFRVINFHGLASRSSSSENQLINLWTALETITSSHSGSGSIVDTVVRETVPVICLNYFYRVLRSLTLDIVRWDRRRLTNALKPCELIEESDLVVKVLCLIAAKENDSEKERLLSSITDFEPMRYRIFELNKALMSGEKLFEKLERHERLVSWQMHRIYRARNQIVHTSRVGANIDSLIVSAHDYFDQVFETTAQLCSGPSGFNTYDEAFRYCALRYVEYKKEIKVIGRLSVEDAPVVLWQPNASNLDDGPHDS